ncbi:MAG: DUF6445 family protein [Hyphomonas sp.]|jgi:hypothetical protein
MTTAPFPVIGRIGHEREPIVIIDAFSSGPAALVEQAAGKRFAPLGPHYPGVRAPADANYLGERMGLLQDVLTNVFGLHRGASLIECNYSLVTARPETLRPVQRLPHFDSTDSGRIAVLHYLCAGVHGGTAFYRHRASGFETVSPSRLDDYSRLIEAEVAAHGLPAADYLRGDTLQFEQTYRVEAAFNRLVIYRGWTLHSGQIPEGFGFAADPRAGRLTINTFLQAR